MVTLTVIYEHDDRYAGRDLPVTATYSGDTELDVLLQIIENHSYHDFPDYPDEMPQSVEEAVEYLQERNGDGTDLILDIWRVPPVNYELWGDR